MSVRILSKVLRESNETLGRRLILIALADEASDDGITWLGQEKIAERTRLSRTHVAELLIAMDHDGTIEIRKAQRGRRRINVYRLRLERLVEIDYDRLPFTLTDPFTDDVGDPDTVTVSDPQADGVGSTGSTVSDLPGKSALSPSSVETVSGPMSDTGAELALVAAPKLVKIDGRDIVFDRLAAECGIKKGSPRMREVAIALNGRKGHPEEGIREQRWRELVDGYYGGSPPVAEFAKEEVRAMYEHGLTHEITARCVLYRLKMPGASLTPTALAKWWTDLPGLPDPGRGDGRVRPRELFEEAARLQREGR